MNHYVDKMIAAEIVSAEIPVQAKSKAGHRTVEFFTSIQPPVIMGKKSLDNGFWRQIADFQPRICYDVVVIIKMPRSLKGVAVDCKRQNKQQDKCDSQPAVESFFFRFLHV